MFCPRNTFTNSLVFFAHGGVARPCVWPATRRPRALPGTKDPARLSKAISGAVH